MDFRLRVEDVRFATVNYISGRLFRAGGSVGRISIQPLGLFVLFRGLGFRV